MPGVGVGVELGEDEQAMDTAINARSMAGTNFMVPPLNSSDSGVGAA